jgi:hypothetical protein
MRHLDLPDSNPDVVGAELHLKCPSPVAIVHRELEQRPITNGPEGTQVSRAEAVKEPHPEQHELVPQQSVEGNRTRGTRGVRYTNAQDQVGLPGPDRSEQRIERRGVVTLVPIQEDEYFGRPVGDVVYSSETGGTVPSPRFRNHFGTRLRRHPSSRVRRAIVYDDDARDAQSPQ